VSGRRARIARYRCIGPAARADEIDRQGRGVVDCRARTDERRRDCDKVCQKAPRSATWVCVALDFGWARQLHQEAFAKDGENAGILKEQRACPT